MSNILEMKQAFMKAHEAGDTENAAILAEGIRRENARISFESEDPFEEISDIDELAFGFQRTDSDIGNWMLWLESRAPQVFGTNPKTYTDEFLTADADQRLEMLKEEKDYKLQQDYPELYALAQQGKTSGLTTTGDIAGALFTPTTLMPLGGIKYGIKGAALLTGALSAQYSISEDLVQTGEIDPTNTAVATLTGAALGGILQKGSNILKARKSAKQTQVADDLVEEVNYQTAKGINEGVPENKLGEYVRQATGMDAETITQANMLATKKLEIPESKAAAQARVALGEEIAQSNKGAYQKGGLLSDVFEVMSDRVGKIAPQLKVSLRNHDMKELVAKRKRLKAVSPFKAAFNKLPAGEKVIASNALKNGDYARVEAVLARRVPSIKSGGKTYTSKEAVDTMRSTLSEVADDMESVGMNVNRIEDYFPRTVKDLDGLRDSLGIRTKTIIDRSLAVKARSLGKSVDDLTEEQSEEVINNVIAGRVPNQIGQGKVKYLKQRNVSEVTDDLIPFYEDDMVSLDSYLLRSTEAIEEARYFGGKGKTIMNEDGTGIDYNKTVGRYTRELMDKGSLNNAQQSELQSLLRARFEAPKLQPSKGVALLRNTGYMFTIGNPLSALTQLQDIGIIAATQGFMPTISAMFGKKMFDLKDFGLDDYLIAELSTMGEASKALDKLLGISGFKMADRFGKKTIMNAAFKRGGALAKKNDPVLASKYKEAFGDEYDDLLKELADGQVTERTKLYVFSELADHQPITMSEVPKKYLEMKDGRLFYSLKTFGIRQLNMMHGKTIQLWKDGYKWKAAQNAALLSTLPALMGATIDETKDYLLTGDFDIDDMPDNYMEKLLQIVFMNKYLAGQFTSSGSTAVDGLVNSIAPPFKQLEVLMDTSLNAFKVATDRPADPLLEPLVKDMPLAGQFIESYFYGGLEKELGKKHKEKYGGN